MMNINKNIITIINSTNNTTNNNNNKILDFGGFDSNTNLLLRGGILRYIGSFLELLSQGILAGIILVGRLDVVVVIIIILLITTRVTMIIVIVLVIVKVKVIIIISKMSSEIGRIRDVSETLRLAERTRTSFPQMSPYYYD